MKSQLFRSVVLAVLVTLVVVVGHLLPGLDTTDIDIEIRNALHVIGFALVAAVMFETLPLPVNKAALTTLVLVAVIGALAEVAQRLGGKGIDLSDLSRDIAGAMLYVGARVVWIWTHAEQRSPVVRYSARLVATVLGVLIVAPVSYWLAVNASIAAQFPTILNFDGRWDTYLYSSINAEVSLVESDPSVDKMAGSFAEILLLHPSWSGLKVEPAVSDWSAYRFLTMRAAIDGGYESRISVHISDGDHPGYRTQHLVGAIGVSEEPTVIRFPLHGIVDFPGRPDLDPSKITDVFIIARRIGAGETKSHSARMFIDDIRLE